MIAITGIGSDMEIILAGLAGLEEGERVVRSGGGIGAGIDGGGISKSIGSIGMSVLW